MLSDGRRSFIERIKTIETLIGNPHKRGKTIRVSEGDLTLYQEKIKTKVRHVCWGTVERKWKLMEGTGASLWSLLGHFYSLPFGGSVSQRPEWSRGVFRLKKVTENKMHSRDKNLCWLLLTEEVKRK